MILADPDPRFVDIDADALEPWAPVALTDMGEALEKAEYHLFRDALSVCVLTMANGYKIVGKSAPAKGAAYNADVGMALARADAVRQALALEAYLRAAIARQRGEADD
jgi:hypothetical protein